MNISVKMLAAALVAGISGIATAQDISPTTSGGGGIERASAMDHVSADDRDRIWRDIDANVTELRARRAGGVQLMLASRPSFIWPLRAARGYAAPAFHSISNFVDHNPAYPDQLRDFQCGTRTYDQATGANHKGTDFSLWPDNWNLMAVGQIEVIAAAPGTIVLRQDGNFDQNCKFGNGDWNAVYVQHDDSSVAWYGHLKKNSLTQKVVGQRVAAGEFLGLVGSSGNSTGPHLHLEVYDASRKLIDPWAGQCNDYNSESWWANQRPYQDSQLNRLFTATAPRLASSCSDAGVMVNPGNWFEKTAFAPGERAYFVATYHDQLDTQVSQYKILKPDGSVWRQWTGQSDAPYYSSSYWWWSYTLDSTAPSGTWMFEVTYNGTTTSYPFSVSASGVAPQNYSTIWWTPAESGWGINLNHQSDVIFATWFTYDSDRSGLWLTMTANLQADGSYTGPIYRTTGINFAQINGAQSMLGATSVGAGALRFSSLSEGTFSYTVNNISQQKNIERQVFAQEPTCMFTKGSRKSATNYQDLWWNPLESGWGINFNHQGDVIFATWFTYRTDGKGQWLASTTNRQPTGEYNGRIYRTTGTPFNLINGTPALVGGVSDVGEMTIAFTDGESATMRYTLDGITQSKSIVRQVFGTLMPLCR